MYVLLCWNQWYFFLAFQILTYISSVLTDIEMEMLVTEQFHIKIQNLQNVRNNQYVIYVQYT